jgi:hypothetical protein
MGMRSGGGVGQLWLRDVGLLESVPVRNSSIGTRRHGQDERS